MEDDEEQNFYLHANMKVKVWLMEMNEPNGQLKCKISFFRK